MRLISWNHFDLHNFVFSICVMFFAGEKILMSRVDCHFIFNNTTNATRTPNPPSDPYLFHHKVWYWLRDDVQRVCTRIIKPHLKHYKLHLKFYCALNTFHASLAHLLRWCVAEWLAIYCRYARCGWSCRYSIEDSHKQEQNNVIWNRRYICWSVQTIS